MGGGVDWAMTGLLAHLGSVCVCVCVYVCVCRGCDQANAAKDLAVSVLCVFVCLGGGVSGRGGGQEVHEL